MTTAGIALMSNSIPDLLPHLPGKVPGNAAEIEAFIVHSGAKKPQLADGFAKKLVACKLGSSRRVSEAFLRELALCRTNPRP